MMYLSHWITLPINDESNMRSKWIYAVIAAALLTGCVSQPAYVPKTDEQIAQELLDKTVQDMKSRGASQDEIDKAVAYSKLSYEDQIKSSVKPSTGSNPAENLVDMISRSLFNCDLQRNSLKIRISQEYTSKTQRKLVQCVVITSRLLSSYYYKEYIFYSPSEPVNEAADEAYLKWNSYVNSILQSAPHYLQEQASLSANDQVRKFQQVNLRDVISKRNK